MNYFHISNNVLKILFPGSQMQNLKKNKSFLFNSGHKQLGNNTFQSRKKYIFCLIVLSNSAIKKNHCGRFSVYVELLIKKRYRTIQSSGSYASGIGSWGAIGWYCLLVGLSGIGLWPSSKRLTLNV